MVLPSSKTAERGSLLAPGDSPWANGDRANSTPGDSPEANGDRTTYSVAASCRGGEEKSQRSASVPEIIISKDGRIVKRSKTAPFSKNRRIAPTKLTGYSIIVNVFSIGR
jgi:hypothetical protein